MGEPLGPGESDWVQGHAQGNRIVPCFFGSSAYLCINLICSVTPDKCCSQKYAALCVQSVGVGWLST